jgi:hypothetical protein
VKCLQAQQIIDDSEKHMDKLRRVQENAQAIVKSQELNEARNCTKSNAQF